LHWRKTSGRTTTLESTQSLTEMGNKNISWRGDKDGRYLGLKTLPPSCAECLDILGASTFWNPKGPSRHVMGLLYSSLPPIFPSRRPAFYSHKYWGRITAFANDKCFRLANVWERWKEGSPAGRHPRNPRDF
jgi:hypothetical protein